MKMPKSAVNGLLMGSIVPIKSKSIKNMEKNIISNMIERMIVMAITFFCAFFLIMSVYAINQVNKAMGRKQFPIIKYKPVSNGVCAMRIIKKEIESGIHGIATPIQEVPTNINNRLLSSKYFVNIVIPIIKEIITKMRLKLPCK